MGQMIDEEDCEVCKPFDQEWIFTYGDLVTLLFCFFVLKGCFITFVLTSFTFIVFVFFLLSPERPMLR